MANRQAKLTGITFRGDIGGAWLRRDGRQWLACCPAVDVITQATTKVAAKNALQEAVEAWFESCIERNVLEAALIEAGFKKAKKGVQPAAGTGRDPRSQCLGREPLGLGLRVQGGELMGETTAISWTDHTWNPWWGCQRVSPGCEHCYAESFDKRVGGAHWGPGSERRTMSEAYWREPLKWNRKAEKEGVRRKVFCASMADVFELGEVQDEARRRLQGLIEATPWLDWLLLTKRPQNWAKVGAQLGWCFDGEKWYEPTGRVWVGVTAEDQKRADERIPILLQIPAAVRFVSYEPALEAVHFEPWIMPWGSEPGLDWIIVGGESGPGARPFDLGWASKTIKDCKAAGVACFVKQLGSKPREVAYPTGVTETEAEEWHRNGWTRIVDGNGEHWRHYHNEIKDPKGGNWDEWPEYLRVRQFPQERAPKVVSQCP